MQDQQDYSKIGFAKTFIVPALWMFVIPVLGLLFFRHAQSTYNDEAKAGMLKSLAADKSQTPEERAMSEEIIRTVPFSTMIQDPEFAAGVDKGLRFDFATFRWMLRIAVISILGGICVFVAVGLCVALSMRSQHMQYVSLSAGWHVLRLYSAFQVIAQGALLVAMSYWVTALWMNSYVPKLIAVVAIMAVIAAAMVVKAIFTRPNTDFIIDGELIPPENATELWTDLSAICEEVGTEPPDQLFAGIDDSFFVTEQPVTVGGTVHTGRTLFVSLSLLRQLDGSEADAVMAHEMAHFSGQDTTYSKKIAPLLIRYGNYLQALHEGGVTIPIYQFMLCFRAMFELSVGKLSREREFRADGVAAQVTSPQDFASGLMKVVAFSKYRQSIEQKLFEQEETSQISNIAEKIDSGFQEFAVTFANGNDEIGNLESSHPFDSHPPLSERASALEFAIDSQTTLQMLSNDGDGTWYHNITGAEQMEARQWNAYEENLRQAHEQSLCYRYLPANAQERLIVEKHFPAQSIEGKDGVLMIDFEKIEFPKWETPVPWEDVSGCELQDNKLIISTTNSGKKKVNINRFGNRKDEVMAIFQNYYARYLTAVDFQKSIAAGTAEQENLAG